MEPDDLWDGAPRLVDRPSNAREDALDLDADWDLLRKRPVVAPPPQAHADDIDADWRSLQNLPPLPKGLYLVMGEDFSSAQLWELACLGERKENREGRLLDCWIVKFERNLWRAPHSSPVTKVAGRTLAVSDFSRQYSIPKNETFLSVEEAVRKLEKIQLAYLAELRRRRSTQLAEMERLRKEVTALDQSIAWGQGVDTRLHVLETARARLLGVLQTQQSCLLGLFQIRVEQLTPQEPAEEMTSNCTRCQRPLDSPGVVGSWSSLCLGCASAD